MPTIEELRTARREVNAQIEELRTKAAMLSDLIREAEGPIPDRTGRDTRVGFRIIKP